jgi:hypothetical protein
VFRVTELKRRELVAAIEGASSPLAPFDGFRLDKDCRINQGGAESVQVTDYRPKNKAGSTIRPLTLNFSTAQLTRAGDMRR